MMTMIQIMDLQQSYRNLKEVVDSDNLTTPQKIKVQTAMKNIQRTLQAQGVFVS